jgi:hypothetical protein
MEVTGQLHVSVALPQAERAPDTHWAGGWVVPRFGLDALEKRKVFLCRLPAVQEGNNNNNNNNNITWYV